MPVDRQSELLTLERLEHRRGETWQGLWLAPLLTIVAQAFLLIVLGDEVVGWLARAAVLAAALAANLAAIWSVLRAHAREVQYSEAIDAELAATAVGDYADVRAAALTRPARRPRAATPAAPAVTDLDPTGVGKTPAAGEEEDAALEEPGEGETTVLEKETELLDPDPPPPPPPAEEPKGEREDWVQRWDRHLVWWAAGESHTKSYMAWVATLAVFMLADVAVYLGTI
jgi:hypothetical protein